jgi:hypothetical protein
LSSGEILLKKEAERFFSVFCNPAMGWGFSHLPKKKCTLAVTIFLSGRKGGRCNQPSVVDWLVMIIAENITSLDVGLDEEEQQQREELDLGFFASNDGETEPDLSMVVNCPPLPIAYLPLYECEQFAVSLHDCKKPWWLWWWEEEEENGVTSCAFFCWGVGGLGEWELCRLVLCSSCMMSVKLPSVVMVLLLQSFHHHP